MYKNVNINAAATTALIAGATVARVRVSEGQLQIRPTNRTNLTNLPKGEMLRKIGTKGSGSRIGLPSEMAENLTIGEAVHFVAGKYGWLTVAQGATENVHGRVSA